MRASGCYHWSDRRWPVSEESKPCSRVRRPGSALHLTGADGLVAPGLDLEQSGPTPPSPGYPQKAIGSTMRPATLKGHLDEGFDRPGRRHIEPSAPGRTHGPRTSPRGELEVPRRSCSSSKPLIPVTGNRRAVCHFVVRHRTSPAGVPCPRAVRTCHARAAQGGLLRGWGYRGGREAERRPKRSASKLGRSSAVQSSKAWRCVSLGTGEDRSSCSRRSQPSSATRRSPRHRGP